MDNKLKPWKDWVPGEDYWGRYLLLHKALLKDGSGITIWRTRAKGYYTVEVWTKRDNAGLPIWSSNVEYYPAGKNWSSLEDKYKEFIRNHGGL